MAAGSGCCRIWRPRTRSWWRWMRAGRGSVTITCSPTCCSWSCGVASRTRLLGCTGPPPAGSPGTGSRWRRSGTPRPHKTGAWPPGGSPTTGRGRNRTGRPAPVPARPPGFPARGARREGRGARGDELARGSLEAAERYLDLAERASVPAARQGQAQLLAGMVRLLLARQRGDRPAVAEEAGRLQALAEAPEAAQPALGEELRA